MFLAGDSYRDQNAKDEPIFLVGLITYLSNKHVPNDQVMKHNRKNFGTYESEVKLPSLKVAFLGGA